jgi:hypothetical protein
MLFLPTRSARLRLSSFSLWALLTSSAAALQLFMSVQRDDLREGLLLES